MNDITSKLAEALKLLLSYTKSCEALLNCSPAGQIALADAALAAYEQAQAEPVALNAVKVYSNRAATPAAPPRSDEADRLLREVFALCEATEDAPEVEAKNEHQAGFERGRRFEAKRIRRGIGTWFQDEFCGRSFMGEPVAATPAPAHLPDATPYLPSAPCGTSTDWSLDERAAIIAGMTFYAARCADAWGVKLAGQGKEASK